MNKLIEIENLNIYSENGKRLVDHVSFSMQEGEILGVVGESGSGKTISTKPIVHLLPENLRWEADKFQVLGMDFLTASEKEKRKLIGSSIGYVPQNTVFYLHPMIRIKNQIADGYILHSGKSKKEAIEEVRVLLNRVGIRDDERLLNSYPWELSGGMRQRVNIAMSMLIRPKLIIADEPTTALDSTVQKQVADLFLQANREHGTSVLMISHDLGLIKHYCQNILVMYAGQILESGDNNSLFSNPMHPYTRALIRVIPSLNIRKGERLAEIPGYIPATGTIKTGCLFAPRCEHCTEQCMNCVEKQELSETHFYRCNL